MLEVRRAGEERHEGWDRPSRHDLEAVERNGTIFAPATPEAGEWEGWGTALKPAWEPICVARKPLIGTVAENVLEYGTGAINIDGCRVNTNGENPVGSGNAKKGTTTYGDFAGNGGNETSPLGRFPANVIHDGSAEVIAAFPGAVSRFFYSAKASKADRAGSKHPTVKPIALMRYLCRLVTPPGGIVLDPFAGSGTTLVAAHEEGFKSIGCEREDEYVADICRRFDFDLAA